MAEGEGKEREERVGAGVKGKSSGGEAEKEVEELLREVEEEIPFPVSAELGEDIREEIKEEVKRRYGRLLQRRLRERGRRRPRARRPAEEEFERFSWLFRIQHLLLLVSCIILIITGLPLKFPDSWFSEHFFRLMGGVGASGVIHRVGASGLIAVGTFHILYISLFKEGRRNFRALIPRVKDIVDVKDNVLYFLGVRSEGARFGRFSYIEKFDYWAVYWGMVVMIFSGALLWWEEGAMRLFPKFVIDMALEAHSDEALLATLAIIIWHFYNVHFTPGKFPMSWTWITGRISKREMIRDHPLEYEEVLRQEGVKTEYVAAEADGGQLAD